MTARHSIAVKGFSALQRLNARRKSFLSRRPHRSFRRTRRRDYVRSLKLPGYFAFTSEVMQTLWRHKRIFGGLIAVYFICTLLFLNILSQDLYGNLADSITQAGRELDLNAAYQAGAIFVGIMTSTVSGGNTDSAYGIAQQLIAGIFAIMAWLSTVWLLRNLLAGQKVKLRDGLYSSGGPLLATVLLCLLLMIQFIPLFIAIIGYAAATSAGILSETVALMLFWGVAFLFVVLSLYWATTTALALVIVTLPAMYPMHALRLAGDIVVGRRVRILLRLVWLLMVTAVAWAVVIIPSILLYEALTPLLPFLEVVPVIPLLTALMGALSVVWSASYVYLLYRRIVQDDAEPA